MKTYFIDVITKQYVDFAGCATRKQYWMYVLFNLLLSIVLSTIAGLDGAIGTLFNIIYIIVSLGLFLPSLAIAVRRLHDTGRSGWWMLLSLLPTAGTLLGVLTGSTLVLVIFSSVGFIFGPLVLLVFFVLPSKR